MSGEEQWARFVEEVPWELDLLEDIERLRGGGYGQIIRRWGGWWLTLRPKHAEVENWMLGEDAWYLELDELDRLLRARLKACSHCGEPCRPPMVSAVPIEGRDWVPLCRACERQAASRRARWVAKR